MLREHTSSWRPGQQPTPSRLSPTSPKSGWRKAQLGWVGLYVSLGAKQIQMLHFRDSTRRTNDRGGISYRNPNLHPVVWQVAHIARTKISGPSGNPTRILQSGNHPKQTERFGLLSLRRVCFLPCSPITKPTRAGGWDRLPGGDKWLPPRPPQVDTPHTVRALLHAWTQDILLWKQRFKSAIYV